MESYYSQIKALHITAALSSGALFLLRGLALNVFAARWPMATAVRRLSWTVDTVLLTAAVMLMTIVHQYPGVDAWLSMKVFLVVVYIVLGYFALRRTRSRGLRIGLWLAALTVFGFIYTVARAHSPWGLFAS
jgi:uncharacterized membrane protein SirB2